MSPTSFSEYASQTSLTEDEINTVESLIERVQWKFDSAYWDEWTEGDDFVRRTAYKLRFETKHLAAAERALADLDWVSFQRRESDEPIRNLQALRYLPELAGLCLTDTEVVELGPLCACRNLRRLELARIPARDISALAGCRKLERLNLQGTTVTSLAVLETLMHLKELAISAEHVPMLRELRSLPALEKLEISGDIFDSFAGFPAMTRLRVLWGAKVRSLEGIDRFANLEALVNFGGEITDITLLQAAKKLTHLNILDCRVQSLAPVVTLRTLRVFRLHTRLTQIDVMPLAGLPVLHEVSVKCAGREPDALGKIRNRLTSWNLEYLSEIPRHTPSLELEIVDQETFDFYDTKGKFGLTIADTNSQLLASELSWIDKRIEDIFSFGLEKDSDFSLPFRWAGARSRSVIVLSDRAVEMFRSIILGLQQVLCHAKNDWILYVQTDGTASEFIIWVYPDRIVTTAEYAERVRGLIQH
jgi:Leucine-rich repeat (LRR) protein